MRHRVPLREAARRATLRSHGTPHALRAGAEPVKPKRPSLHRKEFTVRMHASGRANFKLNFQPRSARLEPGTDRIECRSQRE